MKPSAYPVYFSHKHGFNNARVRTRRGRLDARHDRLHAALQLGREAAGRAVVDAHVARVRLLQLHNPAAAGIVVRARLSSR